MGAVVSLLGMSGVMAVFTDRATTGENSVTSGTVPSAADLQLALYSESNTCGTFEDDLTTGVITRTASAPGQGQLGDLCVRNTGSSTVALTMSDVDLSDVEVGCTNDEEAAGDTTCGSGAGELAQQQAVYWSVLNCDTGAPTDVPTYISQLDSFPDVSLGDVASGATLCLRFEVSYPLNRSVTSVQLAQSDRVTWKWAFDGTTSS